MTPVQATIKSSWRFFPWAIAGGMGLVVLVNITLVMLATHTFPGDVGSDGFTLSNRYNQVIEGTRRDRGFGWQVAADLVGDRLHVKLRDATGAPLMGAQVQVRVVRPVGPPEGTMLPMRKDGAETYISTVALPASGQWDATITIAAGGQTKASTQRLVGR